MYEALDFHSDTPPPRVMSTEMEYMTSEQEEGRQYSQKVVNHARMMMGGPKLHDFLENGSRLYLDCGNIEYAAPESLGPIQQACADIAGERVVKAAATAVLPHEVSVYRRTGGMSAEGMKSLGYHQNFLTPPYKEYAKQRDDARIIGSFLATRTVWAGAGMLDRRYRLSQKAHDILVETREETYLGPTGSAALRIGDYGNRTSSKQKPILSWSRAGGGSMEAHSANWERLEVRFADAPQSPWVRYMGMAVTSLVLRILEHRDEFPDQNWSELALRKVDATVHEVSSDVTFSREYELLSGGHITAVGYQKKIAEMALFLAHQTSVSLPHDEVIAAHELDAICDDLDRYDYKDKDSLALLSDRLDWAARLRFIERHGQRRGKEGISGANPEAARIAILWDQIHPVSVADLYWRKKQEEFYLKHESDIARLQSEPPVDTRARARSTLIKQGYRLQNGNWCTALDATGKTLELKDPYDHTLITGRTTGSSLQLLT